MMSTPSSQTPSRSTSRSRISRPKFGGKDMSWRKPVPRYIPSPPPSPPPSSPASPFTRLSLSLGSAMSSEMPPLPMDWRETIDRALSGDIVRPGAFLFDTGVSQPFSPPGGQVFNIPPITITDADAPTEVDLTDVGRYGRRGPQMKEKSPMSRPISVSPYVHPSSSVPRLTSTYRPPTPPLPSSQKRMRRCDSQMSGLFKPGELVYPDLVGLGEADSNRMVPTSSESSTFVQRCSGGNLARHTLPPYLASWLSLKVGSIDASTLVDEESTLPSYYYRKPSTDSTIVAVDSSHTRAVWHVMKDWTELVASKVKRFGTSAASFWKSTFS